MADVDAAYRRVAALLHPDRLRGMRDEVRDEGERRFREATEAVEVIRRSASARISDAAAVWAHHGLPDRLDDREVARTYNAQVRAAGADRLHATWPGRHAAGLYRTLKAAHGRDGRVQQVEWGAYECTLAGSDVRILIGQVPMPDEGNWRLEPLENLELGGAWTGPRDLGALADLLDARLAYVVTAEVFVGFD